MTKLLSRPDLEKIRSGYDPRPERSLSLNAEAYTDPKWFAAERQLIFLRSWQWVCHAEKLRETSPTSSTGCRGRRPAMLPASSGSSTGR